jgi:hypothetical protein
MTPWRNILGGLAVVAGFVAFMGLAWLAFLVLVRW